MTIDILGAMQTAGARLTAPRRAVARVLGESGGWMSAEAIAARARRYCPSLGLVTVYRTLELLKQMGLVTETDLGNGRVSYHPTGKGQHHHLVCHECGAIIDLDETAFSDLKEMLRHKYGFLADLRHLAIFGHCVKCKH